MTIKPKINTAELRREMRKHGDTNADLAKALDIHSSTIISRKINCWRNVRFSLTEIKTIENRYSLDDDNAIFNALLNYYQSNYKFN